MKHAWLQQHIWDNLCQNPGKVFFLPLTKVLTNAPVSTLIYYMTSSASGQDEPNLALWLATRAGKMELSCPLGIQVMSRKEHLSCYGVLSRIINPLLTKLVRSKWLDIGLALFCVFMDRDERSINTQKKNLANLQPSWPHAWSITHTYHQDHNDVQTTVDVIYQAWKTDNISKYWEESWKYEVQLSIFEELQGASKWSNTVLRVWYTFSIETKTKEETA